jgi:hypothetical protein
VPFQTHYFSENLVALGIEQDFFSTFPLILSIDAKYSFETYLDFQRSTLHYVPENINMWRKVF